MKKPVDLSLAVLKDIRKEIRELNTRVDKTNQRLDTTNERLVCEISGLREELSRRIVESEIRTSTALAELAGSVREMTAVLRTSAELGPRVSRCESEIEVLKQRLPA